MSLARINSSRRIIAYLALGLLCVLFSFIYFLQPAWTDYQSMKIIGPFSYGMNPDSPTWARLVMDFPDYFTTERGKTRIMRPLYVLLARGVYNSLRPLRGLIPGGMVQRINSLKKKANHPEHWVGVNARDFIVAWGSCVVTNFLLYWAAAILIFEALVFFFSDSVAFLLSLLPLLHLDPIKFYLMPHSEPFNLLAPALLVFVAGKYWYRERTGYPVSVLFGLVLTAKALVFPVVNWFYEFVFEREGKQNYSKLIFSVFLLLLPSLAYLAFLYLKGLPLYNHEVEVHRQVVWIADYFSRGNYLGVLARLGEGLGLQLYYIFAGFAAPLLLVGALLVLRGLPELTAKQKFLGRQTWVYTIFGLAFWVVVGNHNPNNSVVYFPLVLYLTGVTTRGLENLKAILISTLVMQGVLTTTWLGLLTG